MNTDDDFKMAFQTGATGVMTDYPSRLKNYLETRPQDVTSLYTVSNSEQTDSTYYFPSDKSS